jgi:sodium transport system permease protein
VKDGAARRGPRRPEREAARPRERALRSRSASNWTLARTICAQQIRALLRDRRALFAAFVLPVLLYPLLVFGRSLVGRISAETLESSTVRVALDVSLAPADMRERMRAAIEQCVPVKIDEVDAARVLEGFEWALGPESNETAGQRALALLATGYDALVVALPRDHEPAWSVLTYFDGTHDIGIEAQRRAHAALIDLADDVADERRLALLGFDPARGLDLSTEDVASPADQSGANLGRWLPLLAIFVLLGGASHAALSAFAGEREAGTLETLLVHPVQSLVVVSAKFAAVLAVGIVTLLLNALALIASLALGLGTLPGGADHAFALDATRVLAGALAFLPAAVLVCALLCLVCGRARTFREGQNLLLPLLLSTILPTLPALQPDIRLDALLAAVPLTGPSLVLRDALRGTASLPLALWMFAASSVWAGLALWRLAVTLDSERLVQHASNEAEARSRGLQSEGALRWALVVVFCVYLVGGWFQSLHPVWGLAATLWILLPLATWFSARSSARRAHESVASILSLRLPRTAHVAAALAVVPAAAWLAQLVFEWQKQFLPWPSSMESVALPLAISGLSPVAQFALLALSPAICEELFFRGALLGGLRRDMRAWRVVAWQAFFFGAVHASIYRFLPTAVLGALLAVLVMRSRSLVPAIVLHAGYNAMLVLAARVPELADPRWVWLGLLAPLCLAVRPCAEIGTSPKPLGYRDL